MSLPEIEDLDAMAQMIGGKNFAQLGPETRMQIVSLVNECDQVTVLNEIHQSLENISDSLSSMEDHAKKTMLTLSDIEKDTTNVGNWFAGSDHYDKYMANGK